MAISQQKHTHEEYLEAYKRCGSLESAAIELGVCKRTIHKHVVRERENADKSDVRDGATSFKQKGDTGVLVSQKGKRISTLKELLRFSRTDLKTWKVDDHVINSWEVTAKGPGGNLVRDFNFQVKAYLSRRIPGIDFADQAAMLKKYLAAFSPALPVYEHENPGDHLLEMDLFDIHYGKLCWKGESGQNMNSKMSRSRVMRSVCTLLERGRWFGIDRILFPVGNDFFNSDNQYDTTAKGTKQHEDGRWQKTFLEGKDLLIEIINLMRSFAPVDVVLVQGNHDFERSFYVAAVLEAVFDNADDVSVRLDGLQRKYYRYGSSLIGLTHGEGVPTKDLPLIMAQESKEMWAATRFREFHAGHIHHKKELQTITTKEYKGIMVRYLRALTGIDAWHSWKGFIGSQQSAEAFLFHKVNGPVANLMVNFSKTDELI